MEIHDENGGGETTVFSVRFYDELVAALDNVARDQMRSRNFLIQHAVSEAVGISLQEIIDKRKKAEGNSNDRTI